MKIIIFLTQIPNKLIKKLRHFFGKKNTVEKLTGVATSNPNKTDRELITEYLIDKYLKN